MNKTKCLIIVPLYNEQDNIDFIVDDLKDLDHDVLFINDASTDNTYQKLIDININAVSLPFNLGIGGCVQTGYLYAYQKGYDIAIQYDGDGQHNASFIPSLIDKINEGYDYVIGSRYVDEDNNGYKSSTMRRIGIKILSLIITLSTGKTLYDVTSGFRACNREVMNCFCGYYPDDYPEPEVAGALARRGYKIYEQHVIMRERQEGSSSIKPIKSIYYMIKVGFSILILSRQYPKKGKNDKS